MPKPTIIPHWADTPATLRTAIPAGVQNTGYSVLTKLPAQYFNWLLGLICDWWVWVTSLIDFTDGIAVTGHVTATTHVDAGTYVNAGTYVKPTSANDIVLKTTASEMQVESVAGTAKPIHVGVGTDSDHAITSRWVHRVSTAVTNLDVADNTERDLDFTSAEYDSAGTMWNIANPSRLVAPETGYYHVDVYAEFVAGAATMNREYILLKHSADARILTAASSGNFNPGTSNASFAMGDYLCCSIDCYLTAGQYVYGRIYQDSSANPNHVNARATMHRIG